MSELGFIGFQD